MALALQKSSYRMASHRRNLSGSIVRMLVDDRLLTA